MFNSSRRLVETKSMHPSVVALTGSPGTGKSTLASRLKEHGLNVITVEEIARDVNALSQSETGIEVETSKLVHWAWDGGEDCIIDGHLSHHCSIDSIIVLRCHPSELRQRLGHRNGYDIKKIESNVEWELLSGVWSDIIALHPQARVIEFDTTNEQVSLESILDFISNHDASKSVQESIADSIDWIGTGNVAESI